MYNQIKNRWQDGKMVRWLEIRIFLSIYLSIYLSICLFASGPGTTSANFLKIGVGARPVAMGEAFVAIADDANTIVHNPAGLAGLSQKEFSAMHLEYFQNIKYESLSYIHPLKLGTFGISFGYLYMNDIKRTLFYEEEVYSEAGKFGACDRTAVLGFGKNANKSFSYGFSVRGMRETLDDISATAFSVDLGLLATQPSIHLSYGFALQNLATRMKFIEVKEKLPVVLRTGVSKWFFNDKLLLAFELYKPSDNYPELKLGTELWLFNLFAPRVGYRYRTWRRNNNLGGLSGLTAGLGIKIYNYTIDYAFVPYGDLGYTHRFSLGGKF